MFDDIAEDIRAERARQLDLWGPQSHGPDRWCVILAEEFGEAARAVYESDPEALREELVQVAAVAVAWIEDLDESVKRDRLTQ